MKRRTFVLGLGVATAAGTTAMGSGAFTSVEANRSASIEVTTDEDAYLASVPLDESGEVPDDPSDPDQLRVPEAQEAPYAQIDDSTGRLVLTFDSLNAEAETLVRKVFRVTNQGDDEVGLWFDKEGDNPGSVEFKDQDGNLLDDGEDDAIRIGVGKSVDVDVKFDTEDLSKDNSVIDTLILNADQESGTQ